MTSYTINIAVDPPGLVYSGTPSTGNFVYTPALLHVETGDQVTWSCLTPFALVFKEGTPINQVQVAGNVPVWETGNPIPIGYATATYPIRNDAKGQFHYAVAVYQGSVGFGSVFMDAGCADVSVN